MTEAFAWLATAVGIGAAAARRPRARWPTHAGPSAAFVLAGAAGAIALLATLLRSRTLPCGDVPVVPVAVPAT